VEVKNIAQQTTLTLNGTDTLRLTDALGIGYLPKDNPGMTIYPNPASDLSHLEFYNSSKGYVKIDIYDFSGKMIISKPIKLTAGNHVFTVSGLKTGIYLVKVNTPEQIYNQRLVSASKQSIVPKINYQGITSRKEESGLKSITNIVEMQYKEGERLVIKAISGNYAHTKSMIITQSHNIDFEFIECLDYDGNHYGVVTIGEQVWMAENLKTRKDAAGNNITRFCYDNDSTNCGLYGGLYSWATVMNGAGSSNSNPSGIQGICPTGWHLPSHHEWTHLEQYICNAIGNSGCEIQFPYDLTWGSRGTNESNALKSCRQVNSPLGGDCNTSTHPRWDSHSTHHGFDEFGFSAVPGGNRTSNGGFYNLGSNGNLWSSTEGSPTDAWNRIMSTSNGNMFRSFLNKELGFSVRCLRDDTVTLSNYILNLDINPSGAGTVNGAGQYESGVLINITAHAKQGWEFINWTDADNHEVSALASFLYTMPAQNVFLTANFTEEQGAFTCGVSTITDIDGNIYNTLLIGEQCWMKENLKTTIYRNGTPIEYPGADNSAWANNTTGAYAWYDNDISWKDSYGALYNWHAVNNDHGLCPTGWHLPSDAEWTQLTDYVVSQGYHNNWNDPIGTGNALKSCRQVNSPLGGNCSTTEHPRWNSYGTHHGFDEFGFSALPSGYRSTNGSFLYIGYNGYWRSSTEYSSTTAWTRYMRYDYGHVNRYDYYKAHGFSVRCLRD